MKLMIGLAIGLAVPLCGINAQEIGEPGARPTVTGTVLNAEGKPAGNVKVSLFPLFWQGEKATDAQGCFTLLSDTGPSGGTASGRVVIARDLDHGTAAALDLTDDATNADLKLGPAMTLTGRVTDSDGRAVSNAQVRVLFETDRASLTIGAPLRTASDGRFECKALPPGRTYGVAVSAKGYVSESRSLEAGVAVARRVELDAFKLLSLNLRIAGVVLDADDQPVPHAWVQSSGEHQPSLNLMTDDQGRFSFDRASAGEINLTANDPAGRGSGKVITQGGVTNIILHIGLAAATPEAEPRRASLIGQPLPDLKSLGFTDDAAPAGKRVLLCLFDLDQRPSRRVVRLLGDQIQALRKKGLTVLAVQATVTSAAAFKEWKDANPLPFPVGQVAEASDKAKWATDVESLPWLILTDTQSRVSAEGFALEQLDEKLRAPTVPAEGTLL